MFIHLIVCICDIISVGLCVYTCMLVYVSVSIGYRIYMCLSHGVDKYVLIHSFQCEYMKYFSEIHLCVDIQFSLNM